jgi:hypothetical protein
MALPRLLRVGAMRWLGALIVLAVITVAASLHAVEALNSSNDMVFKDIVKIGQREEEAKHLAPEHETVTGYRTIIALVSFPPGGKWDIERTEKGWKNAVVEDFYEISYGKFDLSNYVFFEVNVSKDSEYYGHDPHGL